MRASALIGFLLTVSFASVPAHADQASQVAHGALLAAIGGCANCHTAKGGAAFAGGDALITPFGTFYAPNITPDKEAGIGGWSTADFVRALQQGRSPSGEPYYPALPYTSYTNMSAEDLADLKAYLGTVPPSSRASTPHVLAFPFNQRWALRLWQWAFFTPGSWKPQAGRSAEWNRGAYLVEGPGHCEECHTPRNRAGALDRTCAYAGGPAPTESGGKIPNISGDPGIGLGKWTAADLTTLLTLGMTPKGDFIGGEMAKVVNNGTSKLPAPDLAAIVTYLKSLPPTS